MLKKYYIRIKLKGFSYVFLMAERLQIGVSLQGEALIRFKKLKENTKISIDAEILRIGLIHYENDLDHGKLEFNKEWLQKLEFLKQKKGISITQDLLHLLIDQEWQRIKKEESKGVFD